MRSIADGTMTPVPIARPGYDNEDMLTFLEPNLGFSYERRTGEELLIRVYLSLEALPPDLEGLDVFEYSLDLVVTRAELAAAADVWDAERQVFPARA